MNRLILTLSLFSLSLAACSSDGDGDDDVGGAPTVTSTTPATASTGVAVNLPLSATFSRAMQPSTLDATSVVVKSGTVVVPGAVSYAGNTVTFTPAAALLPGVLLSATITVAAKDLAGVALARDYTWTFTTVAESAPPSVSATTPRDAATGVWNGEKPTVSFNKAMDPASLTTTTFTLMQGSVAVTGAVSYDATRNTATFTPAAPLGVSLPYTATITTGARSSGGLALASATSWSFTTRATTTSELPVRLGSAGNFAVLAKTKLSTVPTSAITGDIAVSPAAATFITGFALTADGTTTFATSTQVTGKVYAASYTAPTPSNLTTAINDMSTAFIDAAGRAPDVTELGAGNIGGLTLAPGVYKWGTGLLIPTDVHLVGGPTDVWVFQIAQNLTMSSGARIILGGGAVAKNIVWQVSGLVDLGTTAHAEGIILCKTAITLRTGASINGRLLAQSAVNLDSSKVAAPAQ
ncbi:MAG: DUF3494 domain-containing protein [Deltaproteobacteria bacterium]|nr:DUF3494 domain-containing protein [Deltaproteobacteria bacterium]